MSTMPCPPMPQPVPQPTAIAAAAFRPPTTGGPLPRQSPWLSRRQCLMRLVGAVGAVGVRGLIAAVPAALQAHGGLGPLTPPQTPPDLWLTLHDGSRRRLRALLQGRLTAVQLMFTTCSSTCPIQGAVFAAVQARLTGPLAQAQLLSLSINPQADDAHALARWRASLGADARWLAAAPTVRQANVMLDFVAGGRSGPGAHADPHTAQVYLFDRQGRLAYRCADLAGPTDVLAGLTALASQG